MKFLKYFESFKPTADFGTSSFSFKNSMTGAFFTKLFSKLAFPAKKRKVEELAKEYEQYLEKVYTVFKDQVGPKDKSKVQSDEPIDGNNQADTEEPTPNSTPPTSDEPKQEEPKQAEPVSEPIQREEQKQAPTPAEKVIPKAEAKPDEPKQSEPTPDDINDADIFEMGSLIDSAQNKETLLKLKQRIDKMVNGFNDRYYIIINDLKHLQTDLDDKVITRAEFGVKRDNWNAEIKKLDRFRKEAKTLSNKIRNKMSFKIKSMKKVQEALDAAADIETLADETWKDGAVTNPTWTDLKRKEITSKVNSYKLKEITLQKEIFLDSVTNGAQKKELENMWKMAMLKLQKKWNYIYDIAQIESTSKSIDKPKEEKEMMAVKMTLTKSFKLKEYNMNSINSITDVIYNGKYFLMNFGQYYVLLNKIAYKEEIVFKFIGYLTVDQKTSQNGVINWVLSKYDSQKNNALLIGDKKLTMNTKGSDYPVIVIKPVVQDGIITVFNDKAESEKIPNLKLQYFVDKKQISVILLKYGINNDPNPTISNEMIEMLKKFHSNEEK